MRKLKSITSSSLEKDGQDQNREGFNTETGVERKQPK